RQFPRGELENELRRLLRRRYAEAVQQLPADASLDEIIVAAGQAVQRTNPLEPHAVLAGLPFSLYLSTNGDTLLAPSRRTARTRDGRPKQPQVAALARAGGGAPLQTPPTEAAPLVYHLFGNFQDMDGVVLTEDDYFDFLIDMASDRRQVPSGVLRAL